MELNVQLSIVKYPFSCKISFLILYVKFVGNSILSNVKPLKLKSELLVTVKMFGAGSGILPENLTLFSPTMDKL